MVGLSRNTYINIECGAAHRIQMETIGKLAVSYDVPFDDFADEFMRFSLDGQARRILAYRQSLGMAKKPFCRYTGISLSSLQKWEKSCQL